MVAPAPVHPGRLADYLALHDLLHYRVAAHVPVLHVEDARPVLQVPGAVPESPEVEAPAMQSRASWAATAIMRFGVVTTTSLIP